MISLPDRRRRKRSSRVLALRLAQRHSSPSSIEGGLNRCCGSRRTEITRLGLFVFSGDGSVGLLHLLVVIGLDPVAHHRAAGFAAVSARLHQYRNYNFRRASRSVTHKPGVVLKLFVLAQAAAQIVVDDLRRAALAGEIDSCQFKRAPRAVGFVYHAVHRVGNFFHRGFGNTKTLFSDVGRILEQMRLLIDSTHCDPADGVCELQRSGGPPHLFRPPPKTFFPVPSSLGNTLQPLLSSPPPHFLPRQVEYGPPC